MGVVTPTTKRMLEDTEAEIARLEADLKSLRSAKIVFLPSVVHRYLADR
jgi:hypothetical protein